MTSRVETGQRLMFDQEIDATFAAWSSKNPCPQTELNYHNHFTLLVAVILSAQATDAGVNRATASLFAHIDTPEKMVALGEAGLQTYIKSIGLYRNKAKNIIAMSQRLIAEHGGQTPRDRVQLEALPGVGRKTANVVQNIAFGLPTIAVDTHIFRVANRMGMVKANTPLAVERGLEKRVPDHYKLHAHHWMILHGRYVCKARRPLCADCPVNGFCQYADKAA